MQVLIKKSNIQGRGVFSKKAIRKGQRVFTFSEKKIKIKHPPGCNCRVCYRCIQIGKHIWLYPWRNSYGWNLNHSCEPNCGIKGAHIVAMRDINKGEEITIDYATSTCDERWSLACHCKSKKCRKVIQSFQYLPNRLKRRYGEFILPYFKNQKFLVRPTV